MSELRCIGCGALLQNIDNQKAGYVPNKALSSNDEILVCQRCFRLRHYNEITPISITQDDFYRVVSQIAFTDSLVVKIIDIFDIEGSIIPQISKLTNHNDLIVLINKRDLLPKSVKDSKLLHHVKNILSAHYLKPLDVMIMSAIKRYNLDEVIDKIIKVASGRDIYVVGATNVGKSTFINQILKSYAGANENVITVSQQAGTTLDMIKIPIDNNYIIDTPGIINDIQVTHYLNHESIKVITPKKEIKPKVYQLNSNQTLFLNGFARIDFIKGDKTSFIVYSSEKIKIHRTKQEKADYFYEKHRYDLLLFPTKKEKFVLKKHKLYVKSKKQDIVLPGLGFITVKGPIEIEVYVHEKSTPYIRDALI